MATIVTWCVRRGCSVPSAQRTRWPSTAHEPCSAVILPISSPAGTGSVSVTFCAASGPLLWIGEAVGERLADQRLRGRRRLRQRQVVARRRGAVDHAGHLRDVVVGVRDRARRPRRGPRSRASSRPGGRSPTATTWIAAAPPLAMSPRSQRTSWPAIAQVPCVLDAREHRQPGGHGVAHRDPGGAGRTVVEHVEDVGDLARRVEAGRALGDPQVGRGPDLRVGRGRVVAQVEVGLRAAHARDVLDRGRAELGPDLDGDGALGRRADREAADGAGDRLRRSPSSRPRPTRTSGRRAARR